MLSLKAIVVLALPLFAVANPISARGGGGSACNNGSVNCCNLSGSTGRNCSPMESILGGSQSCTQQTVCCSGPTDGTVVLKCVPININA